jgi:hypothetical protein
MEKLYDKRYYLDRDTGDYLYFNHRSFAELLLQILMHYESKSRSGAEALFQDSPLAKPPRDYQEACLLSHDPLWHHAMRLAHGEGCWLRGHPSDTNGFAGEYAAWKQDVMSAHTLCEPFEFCNFDGKVFFHEDDEGQIELLPMENLLFCRRQMEGIDKFTEAHRDGAFYTDIYLRAQSPLSLKEKRLKFAAVDAALEGIGRKYGFVSTGCYGNNRVLCENTAAYGWNDESCMAFVRWNDDLVETIWLDLWPEDTDAMERILTLLSAMALLGDFLLADWRCSRIVMLSDEKDAKAYVTDLYHRATQL